MSESWDPFKLNIEKTTIKLVDYIKWIVSFSLFKLLNELFYL